MNVFHNQIHIEVSKFKDALTAMAWGIVDKVLEEQRNKLASVAIPATPKAAAPATRAEPRTDSTKILSRALRIRMLLEAKSGLWDRGGGVYKVIGPGERPQTFDLENIDSGKVINATLKTLASRWKHTP